MTGGTHRGLTEEGVAIEVDTGGTAGGGTGNLTGGTTGNKTGHMTDACGAGKGAELTETDPESTLPEAESESTLPISESEVAKTVTDSGTGLPAAGLGSALSAACLGSALSAAAAGWEVNTSVQGKTETGQEAPFLLFFFLGHGAETVAGFVTGKGGAAGTVAGTGEPTAGKDSVEDDADSHDRRLPRFPRRLMDTDGVSGVVVEQAWSPSAVTARTRPSGITGSMPGDEDTVGSRSSF